MNGNDVVGGEQQQPAPNVVQLTIAFDRANKGINLQLAGNPPPDKVEMLGLLELAKIMIVQGPQQQQQQKDTGRVVPAGAAFLNNLRGVRPHNG